MGCVVAEHLLWYLMSQNNPSHEMSAQTILRRFGPLALSLSFVAGVVAYLVATLPNSSLWLDELMSLYYSDPAHAEAGELWRRMTSDLHPPGYYILLYLWRELFGSSIVSVRLLSTALMVLVLGIYVRHVVTEFGARMAALCVPVVAVSHVFLVYAQEVRGYALLMLLSLGCAILYQRVCRQERPFASSLAVIVVLSFLTETIHPYGVLWAGAVCAGLLVFRRRFEDRVAVVCAGLLLLAYPLIRFAWMSRMATDFYNWFAFLDPVVELLFGLSRPLFLREDWWLIAALAAAAAWWLATRQIEWRALGRSAPLMLLIVVLVGMALVIHYAIEPSFNDRNLVILAPVLWLLLPHAIAAVRRTRLNGALIAAFVVLLSVNHIVNAGWLARGFKSEWRASARFVDAHAAVCSGEPVRVFHYVDAERDSYFYRYYLDNDIRLEFVRREDLDSALDQPSSDCPIKFWSPHGLSPDVVTKAEPFSERGYEVVRFDHAAQWQNGEIQGAFVIVGKSSE